MTHTDIPAHLMNEHYDDRYFDVINAMDESRQIFFEYNQLRERLAARHPSAQPFGIGETGFGAGRNVVTLMEYLTELQTSDQTIPAVLAYHSVELHPLSPDRMSAILDAFRLRAGIHVDALLNVYRTLDLNMPGWHRREMDVGSCRLQLHLFLGEALDMVNSLQAPCDVWFLDGHGPKKNPDMWRPELLAAIAGKTVHGGSCSTFTVAGVVRRGLEAAGFQIRKLPGCGGKKDVLQAFMP